MMKRKSTLFYGWVIALACCLSLTVIFGTRLSFQLFFVALIDDFGWSRAGTAGVFSVSMLVFSLTSPLSGWLLDRFGPQRMLSIGAVFFAGGLVISSWIVTQWQLYLWYGVVASVGISILGLTSYATLIANWFRRQRATAMGLAFAGTGIGTLLIVPLTEYWITLWGWRAALIAQAMLLLLIIIPVSTLLLRLHPVSMGLRADGDPPSSNLGQAAGNDPARLARPTKLWTVAEVLRTPAFWLLIVASFGGLFSLRMLTVHQVAAAVDAGFDRFLTATVMGFSGGVAMLAYIGWGVMADWLGRRRTFVISSFTMGGAIIVMLNLREPSQQWLLYLYAVLFGLGEGSRSSLLSAIMSDTFPSRNIGRINGFVGMAFGAGAAAGSWSAGYLFDQTGSYAAPLWISLGITVLSVACVIGARKP